VSLKSLLLLFAASASLGAPPAYAQATSAVSVDQISRGRTTVAPIPQPVASSSRAALGSDGRLAEGGSRDASVGPAPQLVEICRDAALRGGNPEGLDCRRILQEAEDQTVQPNGEGVLLEMLGQSANVTGAGRVEQSSGDADSVARQLSTGAVPGSSANEAAGIVARRDAPPAGQPR
jgi:hypothetical protein